MRSIRMTTVAISLASILPILCVLVKSGDFQKMNWVEVVLGVLFVLSPSIVLACLGYRETKSKGLPIILLISSVLSTGLWSLIALSFMSAKAVDAQSGLVVVFVFGIQLVIVVLATLSFLLLRKK